MDGNTYSEWEGVIHLLSQLQAIDGTIEVWPWAVKDQHHHTPIAINTMACPFFNLQIYVPGLACTNANLRTRLVLGDIRHPSILLRSSVPPSQVVEKLGPWLSVTRQRMWIRQLPLAEQTTCIGWLLYSAPEYNLSLLRQQIKTDTGIDVALRFRSILDDRSGQAVCPTCCTKAIHVEVDSSTSPSQLKCLEKVYATEAKTFPLGIKMRLVSPCKTGTHNVQPTPVGQLICLQARFLKYTETSRISQVNSDVMAQKCPLYDTLRAMKPPPSLAKQPSTPLFHAISPTATNDGYLVRYLPRYRVPALAAIDRLPNQFAAPPVASGTMTVPSKGQNSSASSVLTHLPGHMGEIDQWIMLHFSNPFALGFKPIPQSSSFSTLRLPFSPAPLPSHYKLHPWLAALRIKLQNTAWDKWRYSIGVL